MHRRSRGALPRVVAIAATALAISFALSSPASAARPAEKSRQNAGSTATATASATVSGTTATLQTKISRQASEVSRVSCLVGTTDVGCRLVSTSRKAGATYSATKSGLAAGTHTFKATYTLTNGSTVSASTSFTVSTSGTAPTGEVAACAALGGSFTGVSNQWQCNYPAANAPSVPAASLMSECIGLVMYSTGMSGKVAYVWFSCAE